MTTKMTAKDKKLLIFLCTALLLFFFGWLIIRPLVSKGMAFLEDTAAQEQLRDENQMKMSRIAGLKAGEEENTQKLDALKEIFYPKMTSQEIDRIFTGAVLEKKLEITRLYIKIQKDSLQLSPYLAKEAGKDKEKEKASVYLQQAEVDLTVTGSRKELQSLLDSFANDYKSVLIENVQWTDKKNKGQGQSMEEEQEQDQAILTLNMLLFMVNEGSEGDNT